MNHQQERIDLAAAFQLAARFNLHEAVANHFSLAVSEDGKQFLINPNQRHFSLIKATDLLLLDADDRNTLNRANAPDPTAWGLHGSLHRLCRHARCLMHAHPTYATVLASLVDSEIKPIDQNTAAFYKRYVIDHEYSGLAFESEGERCASLLQDPKIKIMIMGNHGVLVLGDSVSDTLNRLYYFEKAAKNYILALQTGQPLRVLSHDVAEKVAKQLDAFPGQALRHFSDLKLILDRDGSDYAD